MGRRDRGTCCRLKSSTGRSIAGTMTLLTWLMRTMSLKSSWESPGNIQRLSQQRRNLQRKAKNRPSQQLRARRSRVKRRQSLKEKQLLQKEKLLLQHLQRRRPLLPRSREKWDRSSEAAKAIVIPSCPSPWGRVFVEIFLCVTLNANVFIIYHVN